MNHDEDPIEGETVDRPVRTLVKYIRSNTIKNEQQAILLTLTYLTGYLDDPGDFISAMVIGTSSSGKTHLKTNIDALFPPGDMYFATSGSDTSIIYDDEWDESKIAALDELQKMSEELTEILKGLHGGDEEINHKVTMGNPSDGFETETVTKKALPYAFLYAQYDPDFEMFNRLLKIPVDESESKNRAVGRLSAGHTDIKLPESEDSYGYNFGTGTKNLQKHIESISRHRRNNKIPGHVHIPVGDEYDWDVWEIMEPIFNHNRTEVNRIYDMMFNLIRASALFNYHDRDYDEIYHPEHGTIDAIIADPQDVANVLACRETLVSTTHSLDDKRWAICNAIEERGGDLNEVEGLGPITKYLKTSDAPLPPESELENLIEDLADNYLVNVHGGAGDKGQDIYEFLGFDELGFARIPEHEGLFETTFDPVSGQNFTDAHHELREDLESRGDDIMGQASTSTTTSMSTSGSRSDGRDTGGSLSDFGGGNSRSVDLEPHEEAVRACMKRHLDGERIHDMTSVPVEGLVGLTDPNDADLDVDYEGTVLDPDDSVWIQTGKDDSWVNDVQDAKREVRRAVKQLIDKRVVTYGTVHERNEEDKPVDVTVSVLSSSEV